MNIQIRGVRVEITPAIKEHIEIKIGKIKKYFKNPESVEAIVIIKIKNSEQTVEVTVPTKKFTLRAEESHVDLYAAVDLVLDKLERQIRKHKSKIKDRYKKEPQITDFYVEPEEEVEESKIVRRKEIDSKPMDEEEAVLQMELLNHDFFIFNNIDEDCISVIYKRKDKNYGIINTK